MSGSRDSQRAKVYAAEQFVRTMFDRAAEHGDRVVDFFGTSLTLPPEARFGSIDNVRSYVDQVLAMPAVVARWPDAGPVAVRRRRGDTSAHYECSAETAVIAVPDHGTRWAMRELAVFFGHFRAVYSVQGLVQGRGVRRRRVILRRRGSGGHCRGGVHLFVRGVVGGA